MKMIMINQIVGDKAYVHFIRADQIKRVGENANPGNKVFSEHSFIEMLDGSVYYVANTPFDIAERMENADA